MFGENYILGTTEIQVEKTKSRIQLPSFCGAEKGDKLVLLERVNYIEVWNVNDILTILRECQEKIKTSTIIDEIEYYNNQSDMITAFIGCVKELKDKRLIIGKEILEKYNIKYNDILIIEGKDNHIRIWPKDKFISYQEKLKKNTTNKKLSRIKKQK